MITEPLLSNPKGGITALLFIIANEALERLASFGLSTNMIMYLTREYGMDAASGAQILFLYSAAGNFMPIIGAFLADTYVGRYPMIGFGCITSLLGMVLLWLTTIIPEARVPSCAQFSSTCNNEATTPQLLFLYFCLALMSIGAGGIRSCSTAFGADRLHSRCLEAGRWVSEFPVVLMILSTLSFFLASPIYVKPKAKAKLARRICFRVLVASFRKRRIGLCSQNPDELYHHRKGSALVVPSERIRSSGRAKSPNKGNPNMVGRGIVWCAVSVCQNSFLLLRASTMNRHITSKFEIPAGSFYAFLLLSSTIWIALYDQRNHPSSIKKSGENQHVSA
ncbi:OLIGOPEPTIDE TRANSPORTER-RELATED [Salix viminalis]|uniref:OLIGOPEPTIDE TRANSPORTER-RELATED n=1 Tax=Salix viminalis TaxID=40686 RepID=A0A9Q0SEJ5_SALVM|nr:OLIGOPEPTIDE TRANSPORTER-RELATED [Salix viminalis]